MKRRDFLTSLLAGAIAAGSAAAQSARRKKTTHHRPAAAVPSKLDRVGVSTWSFRNYFESTREPGADPPGQRLALLDFPEMIAERYKVRNLEFAAAHFPSLEPTYLKELKANLVHAGSRLINIPVDGKQIGGLSALDGAARDSAIEAAKGWIDIAHQLGTRSIRCDPGDLDAEHLAATIESYRVLAAYGRGRGVAVLIEDQGETGASYPEALIQILRSVGGPFVGSLPDFGAFPNRQARDRGLPLLFEYARTVCHARGLKLDSSGNETAFDFQQCVQIAKQARYHGVYSVEAEDSGDAYQNVQGVINELVRYL